MPSTIKIDGTGPPYVSGGDSYSVTVSGTVAKGSGASDQDSVSGGLISGKVGDGVDDYRFEGTIVSARIPSHADLIVDGQRVTPSDLPISSGSSGGGSSSSRPTGGSSSSPTPTPGGSSSAPASAGSPSSGGGLLGGLGGVGAVLAAGAIAVVAIVTGGN
ncbi:hypothetical protein [Haloarcula salina]|uniref:PGF-CTERM sorting domain-containing protein n=1 Tax=Haloarcula salina TaxID=1429914 RepID=A0AA41KDW5_9EURY|nr:hypothetical protein [Haloarcula salina]MBV0903940.1 hypothetical protein [Haloarcula salina]